LGRESAGTAVSSAENESHDTRRATIIYTLAALVSLVGLGDAIYLTVNHLSGTSARCVIFTGCDKVLSSPYASVGGFPLAGLGALGYFTAFSLSTLAAFGYARAESLLTVVVAVMFLVTLWLLYLQAFVIREYCSFCLLSAIVTMTLWVILLARRYILTEKVR
jgi:uncharacterized membrane protein